MFTQRKPRADGWLYKITFLKPACRRFQPLKSCGTLQSFAKKPGFYAPDRKRRRRKTDDVSGPVSVPLCMEVGHLTGCPRPSKVAHWFPAAPRPGREVASPAEGNKNKGRRRPQLPFFTHSVQCFVRKDPRPWRPGHRTPQGHRHAGGGEARRLFRQPKETGSGWDKATCPG